MELENLAVVRVLDDLDGTMSQLDRGLLGALLVGNNWRVSLWVGDSSLEAISFTGERARAFLEGSDSVGCSFGCEGEIDCGAI
jgi:hypothetical protein